MRYHVRNKPIITTVQKRDQTLTLTNSVFVMEVLCNVP